MSDEPSATQPYPARPPLLVVLSGPSGVGKDVALSKLRNLDRPRHYVVTATTRPKRPNEREGVDYVFLSTEQFQKMLDTDEFLEHAQVYDHWYGVPKQQVREALDKGLDVVLKIDVQGAATIKKLVLQAVFIFLAPPSMDVLRRRLSLRATESGIDLEVRIRTAWKEMEYLPAFDYQVVNPDGCLDQAVACIDAIIQAEKCRIPPRRVELY